MDVTRFSEIRTVLQIIAELGCSTSKFYRRRSLGLIPEPDVSYGGKTWYSESAFRQIRDHFERYPRWYEGTAAEKARV